MYMYVANLLYNWAIPENIHTLPRTASWNSEGGSLACNPEGMGGVQAWNSEGMGVLVLGFPEGDDKESFTQKHELTIAEAG